MNESGHIRATVDAAVRAIQAGRPEEVPPTLRRAIALVPDHAEAHHGLASIERSEGKGGAALSRYRRAVAISPALVDALVSLADTLLSSGQNDAAAATYAKCLTLRPDWQEVRLVHALAPALGGDAARIEVAGAALRSLLSDCGGDDRRASLAQMLLTLLHEIAPVPVTRGLIRLIEPAMPPTETIFKSVGFLLQMSGDPDGANRAYAAAAAMMEERAARHPLASTGLRVILPDWIIRSLGETAIRLLTISKLKALGMLKVRNLKLAAPPEMVANQPFLDLFSPHIDLVTDPAEVNRTLALARDLAIDSTCLQLADGRFLYLHQALAVAERAWADARLPPLLSLPGARLRAGRVRLQEAGLPADAWYVAVNVREPSFHGIGEGRERFDRTARDADISTYVAAMERVVARGGWVIRLGGGPGAPRLPSMPRVVDYSHSPCRSPELDVVILAGARFVIATVSGPAHVASCFGTPFVMTNASPTVNTATDRDIWMPRLYRERRSGRILSLEESLSDPLRGELRGSGVQDYGLSLVDNSSEEIAEATDEMLDRLEGKPVRDDPRVAALYERKAWPCLGPISARFLARHASDLLPG